MNTALILAAGVGQRMRNAGLPKQFLEIFGKPIIIYTLEKFEECEEIDNIVVACHAGYVDYLNELLRKYAISKVVEVVIGGNERQTSIKKGLEAVAQMLQAQRVPAAENTIVIHDGVRPLVSRQIIEENINSAQKYGCAVTVNAVKESVVVVDEDTAVLDDFKERAKTYTLTSPQSFRLDLLQDAFQNLPEETYHGMPLLDAAMVYARVHGKVHLVKEYSPNMKITTPEDFYYLKAVLELEEQKHIFGL